MSNDDPAGNGPTEPPEHAESGHGTESPGGAGTARGASETLRTILIVCALLCMLLGPAGCYKSLEIYMVSGDTTSAQQALVVGAAVSVGMPIAMAAVAALGRDRKAAAWSAALLAWPIVLVVGYLAYLWIGLSFLGLFR